MVTFPHYLSLIIVNEDARVPYSDGAYNPDVIRQTFLDFHRVFQQGDEIGTGLTLDSRLTALANADREEIWRNPQMRVKIRQVGLETDPSFEIIYCYRNPATDNTGFVQWLFEDHLQTLQDTGIRYEIIKKEEVPPLNRREKRRGILHKLLG